MVIRSTFLFSHWNREGKTDDPAIVNSLAFNSETKISDSLCPTILILPHPTPPHPTLLRKRANDAIEELEKLAGCLK